MSVNKLLNNYDTIFWDFDGVFPQIIFPKSDNVATLQPLGISPSSELIISPVAPGKLNFTNHSLKSVCARVSRVSFCSRSNSILSSKLERILAMDCLNVENVNR